MPMKEKWIKLHYIFLNWEWYKDKNAKILFIHCLLKANWKDGKFEGMIVPRGSFVTSLNILSEETGLSKQEVRTALKHLNLTQEVTQSKHSKYTVITIVNYERYQQVNTLSNTGATQEQHNANTALTPIEEYKNIDIIKERIYTACARAREEQNEDSKKIKLFDYDWLDDEHES